MKKSNSFILVRKNIAYQRLHIEIFKGIYYFDYSFDLPMKQQNNEQREIPKCLNDLSFANINTEALFKWLILVVVYSIIYFKEYMNLI